MSRVPLSPPVLQRLIRHGRRRRIVRSFSMRSQLLLALSAKSVRQRVANARSACFTDAGGLIMSPGWRAAQRSMRRRSVRGTSDSRTSSGAVAMSVFRVMIAARWALPAVSRAVLGWRPSRPRRQPSSESRSRFQPYGPRGGLGIERVVLAVVASLCADRSGYLRSPVVERSWRGRHRRNRSMVPSGRAQGSNSA